MEIKSPSADDSLQSRLPPGYLWRQFRRLRAQKDFPFVRVIDRGELEPAARSGKASRAEDFGPGVGRCTKLEAHSRHLEYGVT